MYEDLQPYVALLANPSPSGQLMSRLHSSPHFLDSPDAAERDARLLLEFYDVLASQVSDLTRFSVLAGRLMEIALAQAADPKRLLTVQRAMLATEAPMTARAMSRLLFSSLVATAYEPMTLYMEAQVRDALAPGARLAAPLVVGARAFFTATHLLHGANTSELVPADIRQTLLRGHPIAYVNRLAAVLEAALEARVRQCGPLPRRPDPDAALRICFTLEDFVFDRLNTLTKLYCDYLFLLAQQPGVKLSVRVFRITYNYDDFPIPATWDPPLGEFAELMRYYFGADADAALGRIDFQFVDCWRPDRDLVEAIHAELTALSPDICVTCLDRFHSFLETPVYQLAPLLQIEIINGSRFIRRCDGLIPNGVISASRRDEFPWVEAPLPQIPFPIEKRIAKADLGVPADLYLIAVVGKNFPRRLESEGKRELSLSFARALADLLAAEPGLALMTIGESPSSIADWFESAGVAPDPARLRIVKFASDLRATLVACDLVVNPPIRGGGRGMALAVSDHLPVLIFDGADAANFVPPENVVASLEDFVAKVGSYHAKGAGFRETYRDASGTAPFSVEYNARIAEDFVAAARRISAQAQARLAGG